MGRAKVESSKIQLSMLPIKETKDCIIEMKDFKQASRFLKDIIREMNLSTLSVCKSSISEIAWKTTLHYFRKILADMRIKILIYTNKITTPPTDQWENILHYEENHASAVGGHKRVVTGPPPVATKPGIAASPTLIPCDCIRQLIGFNLEFAFIWERWGVAARDSVFYDFNK